MNSLFVHPTIQTSFYFLASSTRNFPLTCVCVCEEKSIREMVDELIPLTPQRQ